jgi:hypothetical protein
MALQASKKCGLLTPDYKRTDSCTSSSINPEKVPSRSQWRFARRFEFGKQRSGSA